jgi:hypothetical protein
VISGDVMVGRERLDRRGCVHPRGVAAIAPAASERIAAGREPRCRRLALFKGMGMGLSDVAVADVAVAEAEAE